MARTPTVSSSASHAPRALLPSLVSLPVSLLVSFAGIAGGAAWLACAEAEAPARPDVLLVTIDTLRADFVHSYGFAAETTPHMDALAAGGGLFETAVAASTATAPAHASIMSSHYVREPSALPEAAAIALSDPPSSA